MSGFSDNDFITMDKQLVNDKLHNELTAQQSQITKF